MMPVYYHDGRFPPDERLDWQRRLVPLLGPTYSALARYDGMLSAVPDSKILLAPLSTQEAVFSSRIEGTQATMGQVLEFEARGMVKSPTSRGDVLEVIQYRRAMWHAESMLQKLPLSLRVIRESHQVLLDSGRGRQRSPGAYRRIQNWIGPPGCPVEEAAFVPIATQKLAEAMSAWERYMHRDEPDRLVQLAILHAEFEALHPFLDGNGRMGRMLVPLFMWQSNLLRQPAFYISAYFEANRDAYYEGLRSVSRDDDWNGWCEFFLEAVKTQAEDNLAKIEAVLRLYAEMKDRVLEVTNSRYAIRVIDFIFQRPIFTSAQFRDRIDASSPTARRILRRLSDSAVLQKIDLARGRRPALFVFRRLLDVVEGRNIG